ncbi:MAG: hypothetical protein Q4B73_04525 [Lachnospiraceae bacterium]|nr:hypothetical protein [Lachnospiraceae bacterium]
MSKLSGQQLKKILIGTAAGVAALALIIGVAVKANQSKVIVVPMTELNQWYSGNERTISGVVATDVSQNVYQTESQKVEAIHVAEGDTVKIGDPLVTYDMELTSMELEMKKLDREKLQLNIKKAEREIEKLMTGGGGDEPWPEPEPGPEPEPDPVYKALASLDDKAEPFDGDGSQDWPYRFLLKEKGYISGSFFNAMAKEKAAFLIEVRKGDVSNGALIYVWGQCITDEKFHVDPKAKYRLELVMEEPTPTPTPTPTPGPDDPTPTPGPDDPTPTPEPTPTPTEPTPAPSPVPEATVNQAETMSLETNSVEAGKVIGMPAFAALTPTADAPALTLLDYGDETAKMIREKQQEIKGYELDIKEADREIAKIERQLSETTVTAHINGVVKSVLVPDETNGQPLISVVSSEGLYIKGTISENELDTLVVGTKLNGYSYENGVAFEAEIREVSPYPSDDNERGNQSSYPFIAYVADANGLNNNNWVELTTAEDVTDGESVSVEKPFVRTEGGRYYVMKDDGTGHLTRQDVTVTGIVWGSIYKISDGLTMEDKIAFPYGKDVKEGAPTKEGTSADIRS